MAETYGKHVVLLFYLYNQRLCCKNIKNIFSTDSTYEEPVQNALP